MKKKHLNEIDILQKKHNLEEDRLERKRIDMSEMYEAEIAQYFRVIESKEKRIKILVQTIKKALQMMQHPRLMQLITRELKFDRFEYTWEEKLEAAK